jgi:hypothetical protein
MKRTSAFLALAVGFLTAASVQAVPTTYQYTGNPFTSATGPYTTSDFVTGMVTLTGPLAPNMPFFSPNVSPIAFSFSDGVQTLTNHDSTIVAAFATGPTGAITAWAAQVVLVDPISLIEIFTFNTPSDFKRDLGGTASPEGGGIGRNDNSPGTWTSGEIVPDAGSTLSLMTLTLMALGVAARRRFKRAAA